MKENGRSMVEMLGVLAVIGVLSIGGIAGYTTAMSYYRANEILNDINLRATTIATDIATNGALETGTYEMDLGDENALGQTVTATPDDGGFLITVDNVDESTCRNILSRDMKNTPAVAIDVNDVSYDGTGTPCQETNTIAFLFADDLGDIVVENVAAGREECASDADCGENGHCGYGTCIADDEYCDYRTFEENGCQSKNPDRPHCLAYRCVADCTSDDDCKGTENPYCLTFTSEDWNGGGTHSMCVECMENDHCEAGSFCSGSYETCTESSYNTCKKAKVGQSYTASDGKTYYLSSTTMSWWDADNYCKELGKVVGSDLSLVPASILNTKGVDGSTNADWSGTYKTALVGELYTGFGSPSDYWVWTATDQGTSSSSSSKTRSAYIVHLSSGYLVGNYRYYYDRALCW